MRPLFLTALFFSLLINPLFAQLTNNKGFSAKLDNRKYFIENKGQFQLKNTTNPSDSVLFAYIGFNEKYYFTKQGMVTLWNEKEDKHNLTASVRKFFLPKTKKEEKGNFSEYKTYTISAKWKNTSKQVQVFPSEKVSHYYTYGNLTEKANAYKKLLYKNIYPNIDIEYLIPKDSSGIKYNIILHPGADVSLINLVYTGDIKSITQNSQNNIIVRSISKNTGITEYAPLSFINSNKEKIASEFLLENKNHIRFKIDRDIKETIIIDPWVTPITFSIPLQSRDSTSVGYDVGYDDKQNLYVYYTTRLAYFVSKYSSTGSLLWTHQSLFDSYCYHGNFLTEKNTGRTYVCSGFPHSPNPNPTTPPTIGELYRITSAGLPDGFTVTTGSSFGELWDMGFNCIDSSIWVFGGGVPTSVSGGILDTSISTIIEKKFSGYPVFCCQDVVSHAFDNQGRLFTLFASVFFQIDNHLIRVNTALNGSAFDVPTGYTTFKEAGNHWYGSGIFRTAMGHQFNALAVNDNYLVYYDGINLKAFDPNTGASLGSDTVTGHTAIEQSGIAIDDCNNVYIGGNNGNILYYHFDGTNFTLLGDMNLGFTDTVKNVHDIMYDRSTNLLYVSGRNNIGVYDAIASSNCNVLRTSGSCLTPASGKAIAVFSTPLVNTSITYIWTDKLGNIIRQTDNSTSLSDTVTGLNTGTYFITTYVNSPCGPVYHDSVNVSCCNLFMDQPADIIVCNGDAVPVTVFTSNLSGTTYDWINSNPSIGLPMSGTGNVPAFIATNTSNHPIIADITIVPSNTGCTATPSIYTITINDCKISLNIPNVFTPNGDGNNDFFTIQGVNIKKLEGEIFNRWGTKMFSWNDINEKWDGKTPSGKDASAGTYFFIIKAEGQDDKQYRKKGNGFVNQVI